jgi:hypothetical protein
MTVNSVLYFVASVSLEMGLGHSPSSKKISYAFHQPLRLFLFAMLKLQYINIINSKALAGSIQKTKTPNFEHFKLNTTESPFQCFGEMESTRQEIYLASEVINRSNQHIHQQYHTSQL